MKRSLLPSSNVPKIAFQINASHDSFKLRQAGRGRNNFNFYFI